MKQNTKTWRSNRLLIFFSVFLSILIFNACRKLDLNQDKSNGDSFNKFFNVPADANPIVKRLAETMRQYNNRHEFVKSFVKKRGLPVWNRAPTIIGGPSSRNGRGQDEEAPDTLVIVPIINESGEEVVSFFACKINEDSI